MKIEKRALRFIALLFPLKSKSSHVRTVYYSILQYTTVYYSILSIWKFLCKCFRGYPEIFLTRNKFYTKILQLCSFEEPAVFVATMFMVGYGKQLLVKYLFENKSHEIQWIDTPWL